MGIELWENVDWIFINELGIFFGEEVDCVSINEFCSFSEEVDDVFINVVDI